MNLPAVQEFLRRQRIDAWLLHDFRGSNPILARLVPPESGRRWTTRRVELLIPASGPPELLIHNIDSVADFGPIERRHYTSWGELHEWLAQRCRGRRIAMDYSPGGALPAMSYVDAGTIELVRGLGAEVVSSADLIQAAVATWSSRARENHTHASREVARIKDAAFDLIRSGLSGGRGLHEYEVQQFIMAEFQKAGLETPESPIVAVNAHSGDPHYAPSESQSSPIRPGDWVLIDLWARVPGDENIFSDITWVGYCGRDVPAEQREVFGVVKRARDAALAAAKSAGAAGGIQGWQLDEAAMHEIRSAGYSHAIRHRTGHSLSPGPLVHGLGMNLDNLETHDTRAMLPGIGFTIEPGVYLPEFGVRLEINVFVDPQRGPDVTSCVQDEIILLA
jgi:Xaa-Pro dipeptidase